MKNKAKRSTGDTHNRRYMKRRKHKNGKLQIKHHLKNGKP
jgi:hypothetical protein